jgi:hypothetical protein
VKRRESARLSMVKLGEHPPSESSINQAERLAESLQWNKLEHFDQDIVRNSAKQKLYYLIFYKGFIINKIILYF